MTEIVVEHIELRRERLQEDGDDRGEAGSHVTSNTKSRNLIEQTDMVCPCETETRGGNVPQAGGPGDDQRDAACRPDFCAWMR